MCRTAPLAPCRPRAFLRQGASAWCHARVSAARRTGDSVLGRMAEEARETYRLGAVVAAGQGGARDRGCEEREGEECECGGAGEHHVCCGARRGVREAEDSGMLAGVRPSAMGRFIALAGAGADGGARNVLHGRIGAPIDDAGVRYGP